MNPEDPDRLRRDIEETQQRLGGDVDAFADKVTPSRVVERGADRARATATRWKDTVMGADPVPDAVSTAAETLRDAPEAARRQARGNPIAAGLIAFGAGWLAASLLPAAGRERHLAERAHHHLGQAGGPAVDAVSQAASQVRDALSDPAAQAADSVASTAGSAGRTVLDESRTAAEQVGRRATDAVEDVRDVRHDAR
ncbi:DUF3618 domain-containing protein [Pseudonocardia sp. KRD291]|uniref:DUF3618 domain-containing protein n=1 Tax=Pseudonocardia sp. KRD291 TaxID=2792007 RepID=UPI001C4A3130|nr:DUF3618 domain-containing protein [Pseudonocardia sp. KRD291]MBW0106301.1 DUF3618 domain-containing protein [Pseudonocardia sp. KRD291]